MDLLIFWSSQHIFKKKNIFPSNNFAQQFWSFAIQKSLGKDTQVVVSRGGEEEEEEEVPKMDAPFFLSHFPLQTTPAPAHPTKSPFISFPLSRDERRRSFSGEGEGERERETLFFFSSHQG